MPSGTPENLRAIDDILGKVYQELRQVAARLQRNSKDTLTPSALVHEAYLKLIASPDLATKPQDEFVRIAAAAMRQIMIDSYRRKHAMKRGDGIVQVKDLDVAERRALPIEERLDLHQALEELARLDPRQARIIECQFFFHLTAEETAQLLGCSKTTVERQSRVAKAWLKRALGPKTEGG